MRDAATMTEIPVAVAAAFRELEAAVRDYLGPLPYRKEIETAKARGDVVRAALARLDEVRS